LARELVQLHRGEITVSSEVGRGTSFRVCLPLGKEHLSPEEIIPGPAQLEHEEEVRIGEQVPSPGTATAKEERDDVSDNGSPVILIIEDNVDMRSYMREQIGKTFSIIEAENGLDGFEKATTSVPDLIISDVMMPKMDGYEVCRQLKGDVRTSHIPVILLTAKAGTGDRIEGWQIGADDYLVKPFDGKELMVRIANLIEQRRLLRVRFRSEIVLRPNEISVTTLDEKFLKRVMELVEEHLADSGFDTEAMAKELFLSRMQLHRKLKALSGRSPHDFVRQMRLQRAAQLLRKRAGNVSEVAFEVGFNNLSHFAKSFREEFGKSPSEFLESLPKSTS
jgi:DNA-binding response OmpR family regulator